MKPASCLAAMLLVSLAAPDARAAAPPAIGAWGLDLSDADPAVRPGDDFYLWRNGGWYARHPPTPAQPRSAYWLDLRRAPPARLAAIMEGLAADPTARPTDVRAKVAAFYRAALDEPAAEARGVTPLAPRLGAIRHATTRAALARLMGEADGPGSLRPVNGIGLRTSPSLFAVEIRQDQRDPGRYAVYLGQAGLMLPGPEYYADPGLADVRDAYQAYAARALALIGWPDPDLRARQILAFETEVAAVSWTHAKMADPARTYHPLAVAQLRHLAPGFDWGAFLAGAELNQARAVVVDADTAFPRIAAVYARTPVEVLQARLALATADAGADQLTAALAQARQAFRRKAFNQVNPNLPPRRLRAEQAVEAALPDAVGALYVADAFSAQARSDVLAMTDNLKAAFAQRLDHLAWMTPAHRRDARRKLAAMTIKLGYPDRFETYDGLEVRAEDPYGDTARAAAFAWRRRVARLAGAFDRAEWSITPNFANYAYSPAANALEVPAALLQPPFFDAHADPAVNYGAMGVLIGSLMTAGFDARGRLFDADGRRLGDRLTPGERRTYDQATARIVTLYSAFEPLPGVHLQGRLLSEEALDDLGGLAIALDAYHRSLGGRPAPVLDGLTGDQRFFMGWAQMWRARFDTDFTRNQVATGQNAPPSVRVDGPLPHLDAWYAAFGITPGDRLYLPPRARVRIW